MCSLISLESQVAEIIAHLMRERGPDATFAGTIMTRSKASLAYRDTKQAVEPLPS